MSKTRLLICSICGNIPADSADARRFVFVVDPGGTGEGVQYRNEPGQTSPLPSVLVDALHCRCATHAPRPAADPGDEAKTKPARVRKQHQ